MVRKMGDKSRKEWWDQNKRLQTGALVCILDVSGMIQFCVVSESTLRTEQDRKKSGQHRTQSEECDRAGEKPRTLSSSSDFLYVRLHLVDTSPAGLGRALRWCKDAGPPQQRHLVEFPGVLLASFKHTLEALQKLSRKPDLPFSELIAPEPSAPGTEARVSAPLYARAPGFVYDLSCLIQNEFNVSIGHLPAEDEVSGKTGRDLTQSEALLSTLSRELSLIQGPPGTGKSYTGQKIVQVLLANRLKANLGPIICVCYTNHALDQLLEHLLDNGVGSIIRMGSRSKSERLQELTLQVISERMDMTRTEKRENWEQGQRMRGLEKRCQNLLDQLASCDSSASIEEYLRSTNGAHHDELFPRSNKVDEEGFTIVDRRTKDPLQHWLREEDLATSHTRSNVRDVAVLRSARLSDMTYPERMKMFHYWLTDIRDVIVDELVDLHQEHRQAKEKRDRIRECLFLVCLCVCVYSRLPFHLLM